MKILLFLLFPFILFGQILLNETFSNFNPNLTVADGAVYWFTPNNDSSNALKDISGGNHTLVARPTSFTPTYPVSSVLTSGDSAIFFQSSGSNTLVANDHADFDITTTHSLILLFKPINLSQTNEYLFEKRNARYGMIWEFVSDQAEYVIAGQTGSNLRVGSKMTCVNDWNLIVYTYAPGSFKGYKDGFLQFDSAYTTTLGASTDSFYVACAGAGGHTNFFDGYMEYLAVIKGTALTYKQVSELMLAYGWTSPGIDSTRVIRDSWAFSQGVISDTIYYNTALTAGKWSISVDVDGNSGGETYRVLTSADASTWSDIGSGTAPASSTTKTFSGTGSGYIGLAVSSAADTVYFDNLTVSLVTSTTSQFKQHSAWNKFKGW